MWYFVGSTEECLEYPDIPHSTVRWEKSFRAALVECEPGKFIHVNGIAFHSISIKCQNGEWMSADGIKNLPECVRDTGTKYVYILDKQRIWVSIHNTKSGHA